MIDYANQIVNLISRYAPLAGIDIGQKYQAKSVTKGLDKVSMELDPSIYLMIKSIINDPIVPNKIFTISGFFIKNKITSFVAYPSDSSPKYAITIGFELPHNLKNGETFSLKNFLNAQYNTVYKVLKTLSDQEAVVYPIDSNIPNITINTGLGYSPIQYTEGYNGVKTISDEGNNIVSFEFDKDLLFAGDIDFAYLPLIHNHKDNIKAINSKTFFSNLTKVGNDEYLIVDTASLVGSPVRSNSNKSDLTYNAFSRSGRFNRSYTLNLLYLLQRNIDDINNQTISGSDIVAKQVGMYDRLTSVIRQPMLSNDKILSSITISSDKVDNSISEGRVVIVYTLTFSATYEDSIMIDIDNTNVYPLNYMKVNTDTIDLTKFK